MRGGRRIAGAGWRMLPLVGLLALSACVRQTVRREAPGSAPPPGGKVLGEGLASYYGAGLDGRPTASGERFNRDALTAAHRTLRFGTCVEVLDLDNGRTVRVRVNDRGPFAARRVIDVSEAAARSLGMIGPGLARVRLFACQ